MHETLLIAEEQRIAAKQGEGVVSFGGGRFLLRFQIFLLILVVIVEQRPRIRIDTVETSEEWAGLAVCLHERCPQLCHALYEVWKIMIIYC